MKALLQKTCKKINDSDTRCLNNTDYKRLQKSYRCIITQGEKELPAISKKANGKKGCIAKSDAHNLWERFKKHELSILRFAKDPHVAFTNNRAERDLRMAKVKQKVSGCFRAKLYAEAYCRTPAIYKPWPTKGLIHLSLFRWPLMGKLMK